MCSVLCVDECAEQRLQAEVSVQPQNRFRRGAGGGGWDVLAAFPRFSFRSAILSTCHFSDCLLSPYLRSVAI